MSALFGRLPLSSSSSDYNDTWGNLQETMASGKQVPGSQLKSEEIVVPKPKNVQESVVAGKLETYHSEITPTDFIPTEQKDPATQVPDYYRNGNQRNVEMEVDGKKVRKTFWSPLPERSEERPSAMLASIKLVDDRKIAQNGKLFKQLIPEYSKFFLESCVEGHQEKVQTVETFNDFYAYFYGERPPVYTFSGHLLNFRNYNWLNEFMFFYQNFWRGTKAVSRGAKIYVTYNYQQVHGYILNIQTNLNALTDKAAPFSFSMLVTKKLIFTGNADDGVIRDSLLPYGDNGLVDLSSDNYADQLIVAYQNRKGTAISNNTLDSKNLNKAKGVVDGSRKSTQKNRPQTQKPTASDAVATTQNIDETSGDMMQYFKNPNAPLEKIGSLRSLV